MPLALLNSYSAFATLAVLGLVKSATVALTDMYMADAIHKSSYMCALVIEHR